MDVNHVKIIHNQLLYKLLISIYKIVLNYAKYTKTTNYNVTMYYDLSNERQSNIDMGWWDMTPS